MESFVFVGDITEWELKKRLDFKIQQLQKRSAQTSCVDLQLPSEDPIEDLLNNLAYRCVVSDLSESLIESEIQKIMDEIRKISESSEKIIEVPFELDESDYMEESCLNCDQSFNFNDTIEEMERLLRDGLPSESDNELKSVPEIENKPKETVIKFDDVDMNVSTTEVEQLSCVYSKNFENRQSAGSERSVESTKSGINYMPFKVPTSSCKKPQTKISTPTNKLYKDVVSPVAFYIKNSGVTPIKQTLKFTPEKHLYRHSLTESVYCDSATNDCKFLLAKDVVIPEVFYKPAVKKIISQEQPTKIPNSINKLVGILPDIIIHEQRIRKGEPKPNTNTMNPNYSLANEDISIYITKQAEIK